MKLSHVFSKIFICFILFFFCSSLQAGENASPKEVVKKVKQAAAILSKKGKNGLKDFTKKTSKWVWKDTYIWVMQCEKKMNVAHPIKPKLVGRDLMGIKDKKGNYFFIQFCDVAKSKKGGWVEYWWPKVGEKKASRKISLIYPVPNTPYQLGAGVYNDSLSIDELNKLID